MTRASCSHKSCVNRSSGSKVIATGSRRGQRPPKKTTDVFITADCSIVSAAGIIEDVMVKVGRLVIPTDFHVIQPPPGERGHPQVLLGRPFLKISGFKLTYTDDIFTF
ncbi:hypothetical protein PIB30_054195 [Stylosanthes scabra]|uniref:Uncharacterized protein n=1 Tax=Stylosanthes scabra TaxID=79078 RepID=A0ABU6ZHF6_9FABA|nr:hypothetical protein [Stylosanthes scabra]